MAIKFNKENKVIKSKTSKPGKLCTFTLVIQIILTLSLGIIGFAPVLSIGFGSFLFLLIGAAMILITIITAGIVWTVEGMRNFFFGNKGAFKFAQTLMESGEKIVSSIKPCLLAIALPIFIVAASGFIYNLIYFIKKEKANKGRFITSCIFLGLAIINLICAFIIYYTYKS